MAVSAWCGRTARATNATRDMRMTPAIYQWRSHISGAGDEAAGGGITGASRLRTSALGRSFLSKLEMASLQPEGESSFRIIRIADETTFASGQFARRIPSLSFCFVFEKM